MNIIIYNSYWMLFNVFLAVLPIIFGWIMYTAKSKLLKAAAGLLWILFIPNSIYIFTDIAHLPKDLMSVDKSLIIFVFIQYAILLSIGAVTFILGMYPFKKLLTKVKNKNVRYNRHIILILANLFIGFAIVLGRFQQTNSWEVFSNIQKVISNSVYVFTSYKLLSITILFGIISNIIYFTLIRIFHALNIRKV